MAVYWINLDRSKERKKNMEQILKDPSFDGMEKYRIEAYDGLDPETETIMRTMIPITNPKVTIKEYACFLSHLKSILTFSNSNHEYALILEDDASLDYKPYWTNTFMECIHDAPLDWEILQLCFFGDTLPEELYSSKHYYSCTAYIIHKTAAIKLMKMYQSNFFTLDDSLKPTSDVYLYKTLKTYVYRYPFFTYENIDTTIFQENELIHRGEHKQNIKRLLYSLLK